MELLKVILKQLQVIHAENMLIIATLNNVEMDDKNIQGLEKAFDNTWGELKK